jgi:DNA-binding response OmpR family regulator
MAAMATVLVIDDDKDLVNLFRADLRVAGCNVLAAFDAMQGFMLAQREVPSLILLDLQLPAGGGMQLLEKLAKSGKTQAIPVVMVTATDDPKLEAETLAKGAVAFLRKPVDRAALVALVQSVLERQP